MKADLDPYVATIGLEIHVELATRTKMFCGCAVAFAGVPNSRVCPVCLGHPGTLPVPNEAAVAFAVKIALALGCEIAPDSIFHRKNYFYPDMPKNYQISQYDAPIGVGGFLDIEVDGVTRRVGITRVHLEEDTGKTIHVGGGGRIHEAEYSLEDFNRAGTPLVEIVTEPDMSSPEEARAFAHELLAILEYLGVSDVRLEEGSLRFDANISVAPAGERGTKAEVKNMNSLRSLYRALVHEAERQGSVLTGGGALEQSTRHWDEKAGVTKPMRTKEHAFDYRYFPEPDLVPLRPSSEWLQRLREEIPELPSARRRRFVNDLGLPLSTAALLASTKAIADFYEEAREAAQVADAKQVANWVANDLLGRLAERGEKLSVSQMDPVHLAGLVDLVAKGRISGPQAKEVLAEMVTSGRGPEVIIEYRGLMQLYDQAVLEKEVEKVVAANPEVAERIRAGQDKALGFLVGQVMRATRGRANPALVNELLREQLGPPDAG